MLKYVITLFFIFVGFAFATSPNNENDRKVLGSYLISLKDSKSIDLLAGVEKACEVTKKALGIKLKIVCKPNESIKERGFAKKIMISKYSEPNLKRHFVSFYTSCKGVRRI